MNARGGSGCLDRVIAVLEIAPERVPAAFRMPLQIGVSHAERKDVHLDLLLAGAQRLLGKDVDSIHHGIGHRETTDGSATPMQQDVRASAAEGAIECIGKPDVDGAGVFSGEHELVEANGVEALGRLMIALKELGPEVSRPEADRIGRKKLK